MRSPRLRHIPSAWVLLCLLLSGCAAVTNTPSAAVDTEDRGFDEDDDTVLEMETLVIRANIDAFGNVQTSASELRELFDEARDYYNAGDYANAVRLYQTVLGAAEDPLWLRATLYNLGLSYEGLEDWEMSAYTFNQVIEQFPISSEARDAHFRLAEAFAWLGEFQRVPPLMTAVTKRPDVQLDRRLEALVRSGTAYFEMRAFSEASRDLERAIALEKQQREREIDEGKPVQRGKTATHAVAQANYLMGRIYHEIFSEIRMVLPVERYKRDLADKQRVFEQALNWYTRAVRTGHNYWAPQAGYMIGKIYEDYYFDILASETPDDFTEEHVDVYFEAMREYLEPTLRRGIENFEKALGMSYRMGSQDAVVDTLVDSIHRLKAYLDDHVGWEEEQQQILRGLHPHSPRPSSDLVFRQELRDP